MGGQKKHTSTSTEPKRKGRSKRCLTGSALRSSKESSADGGNEENEVVAVEKDVLDDNDLMIFYQNRLDSFKRWPFTDGSCTAENMAAAGFYNIATSISPDGVKCFACLKELDGWEPEDDPWTEHESHSKHCEFVKMGKKDESELTVDDMLTRLAMQASISTLNARTKVMRGQLEEKTAASRKAVSKLVK